MFKCDNLIRIRQIIPGASPNADNQGKQYILSSFIVLLTVLNGV